MAQGYFSGSKRWILLSFTGFLMTQLPCSFIALIGWAAFGVGLLAMLIPVVMKLLDQYRGFK